MLKFSALGEAISSQRLSRHLSLSLDKKSSSYIVVLSDALDTKGKSLFGVFYIRPQKSPLGEPLIPVVDL